jgi:hypothetical protein
MHAILAEVIAWASDAARWHVVYARHANEPVELEWGMGHWQSFQAKFPKTPGIDYDILCTVASHTYSNTVTALEGELAERGKVAS